VAQAAVRIGHLEADPGVVGPVTGRPDDGVDVKLAAAVEAHRPPRRAGRARLDRNAEPALQLAWARADERVPVLRLATDP
jgi:hypothetical protein